MSTTLHPHALRDRGRVRDARDRATGGAHEVGTGLWRALRSALVPGTATDDVVPAIHAVEAQTLLVRAGALDTADVTARWDGRTTDAVRRYQSAHGLDDTGVADRRTTDALLGR